MSRFGMGADLPRDSIKADPSGFYLFCRLRETRTPDGARRMWARLRNTPCPFDYKAPMIVLDLETCSTVDLTETGAARYAEDSGTHVLVVGWCIGALEPEAVILGGLGPADTGQAPLFAAPRSLASPTACPPGLLAAILAGTPVVAHNAEFEMELWSRVLVARYGWPPIPLAQWRCTMAHACLLALPASLSGACAALNLDQQKDMGGRSLMLKMCKPAAETKTLADPWRNHSASNLAALADYCKQDVRAERALHAAMNAIQPMPEDRKSVV